MTTKEANAQLPALLCEGGRRPLSVHGAERPGEDASNDLSEVEQVGETVIANSRPLVV